MAGISTQDVLSAAGRPGWRVISITPEMQKNPLTADNWSLASLNPQHFNEPYPSQVPTGKYVMQVQPPNGTAAESQQIVVAADPSQVSGPDQLNQFFDVARKNGADPYQTPVKIWDPNSIVAPDKAGTTTPASANKGGPLSDYQTVPDPRTGQPIAFYNPKTGDKIDLPALPKGGGAQVVDAGGGRIYSWDGTTLTPLTQADPQKPQIISGAGGAIYSWDGSKLTLQQPGTPPKPATDVVGNKIVNTETGAVIYDGGQNLTLEKRDDGSVWGIDPTGKNPAQQLLGPQTPTPKPPQLVPGQDIKQPNFVQQDPMTGALSVVQNPIAGQQPPTTVSGQTGPNILQQMPDGSYQSQPNPAYVSKQQQGLDDLHAGINQIQQSLSRGEIDVPTANKYKDLLQQNYETALQGTTPYQQYQDQAARKQAQANTGASLLNQRVASGSGLAQNLVSSALGIVGNKNFMDPSAVAGFAPFAGARDYVTDLGGGSDVYQAAANAVKGGMGPDPASALLSSALGGGGGMQSPGPQPPMPQQQNLPPPGMAPAPPQPPTPFAQSGMPEGSNRNMLGLATGQNDALSQLLIQAALSGLGGNALH